MNLHPDDLFISQSCSTCVEAEFRDSRAKYGKCVLHNLRIHRYLGCNHWKAEDGWRTGNARDLLIVNQMKPGKEF